MGMTGFDRCSGVGEGRRWVRATHTAPIPWVASATAPTCLVFSRWDRSRLRRKPSVPNGGMDSSWHMDTSCTLGGAADLAGTQFLIWPRSISGLGPAGDVNPSILRGRKAQTAPMAHTGRAARVRRGVLVRVVGFRFQGWRPPVQPVEGELVVEEAGKFYQLAPVHRGARADLLGGVGGGQVAVRG